MGNSESTVIIIITSWMCSLEEGKILHCVYEHLRYHLAETLRADSKQHLQLPSHWEVKLFSLPLKDSSLQRRLTLWKLCPTSYEATRCEPPSNINTAGRVTRMLGFCRIYCWALACYYHLLCAQMNDFVECSVWSRSLRNALVMGLLLSVLSVSQDPHHELHPNRLQQSRTNSMNCAHPGCSGRGTKLAGMLSLQGILAE